MPSWVGVDPSAFMAGFGIAEAAAAAVFAALISFAVLRHFLRAAGLLAPRG